MVVRSFIQSQTYRGTSSLGYIPRADNGGLESKFKLVSRKGLVDVGCLCKWSSRPRKYNAGEFVSWALLCKCRDSTQGIRKEHEM